MTASSFIFDCDGVLVDSEAIYQTVERAALREAGLTYEHAEYSSRFTGLPEAAFIATLRQDFKDRGLGVFPEELPAAMNARSQARLRRELKAVAGVTTFLQGLTGAHAVASSSSIKTLDWKLAHTALAPFFGPRVYSGDLVAHGKPAPDLFLLAAEKLQAAPDRCIVIEDSVNGVRAGVRAGMEVWGFTGGSHADAGLPDRLRHAGAAQVFGNYRAMAEHAGRD